MLAQGVSLGDKAGGLTPSITLPEWQGGAEACSARLLYVLRPLRKQGNPPDVPSVGE